MSYLIYMHVLHYNCAHDGWGYIGLTKQSVQKRWKYGNGYTTDHPPVFAAAIKKYGWKNFEHLILEDNIENLELANKREKYWISYYHTWIKDPECHGYNITQGGDGQPGKAMTDETKEKIKALRWQKLLVKFPKELVIEIYDKILHTDGYSMQRASSEYHTCSETLKKLFGYYSLDYAILYKKLCKHSEETKKVLSEAAKKRDNSVYKNLYHEPMSNETKEKIRQYHLGRKLSEAQKQKIGASRKGKKLSKETKAKISIKNKGKKISKKQKEQISRAFKNRKHITNGIQNKFILETELAEYLANGWRLGRTIKKHEK